MPTPDIPKRRKFCTGGGGGGHTAVARRPCLAQCSVFAPVTRFFVESTPTCVLLRCARIIGYASRSPVRVPRHPVIADAGSIVYKNASFISSRVCFRFSSISSLPRESVFARPNSWLITALGSYSTSRVSPLCRSHLPFFFFSVMIPQSEGLLGALLPARVGSRRRLFLRTKSS